MTDNVNEDNALIRQYNKTEAYIMISTAAYFCVLATSIVFSMMLNAVISDETAAKESWTTNWVLTLANSMNLDSSNSYLTMLPVLTLFALAFLTMYKPIKRIQKLEKEHPQLREQARKVAAAADAPFLFWREPKTSN